MTQNNTTNIHEQKGNSISVKNIYKRDVVNDSVQNHEATNFKEFKREVFQQPPHLGERVSVETYRKGASWLHEPKTSLT